MLRAFHASPRVKVAVRDRFCFVRPPLFSQGKGSKKGGKCQEGNNASWIVVKRAPLSPWGWCHVEAVVDKVGVYVSIASVCTSGERSEPGSTTWARLPSHVAITSGVLA